MSSQRRFRRPVLVLLTVSTLLLTACGGGGSANGGVDSETGRGEELVVQFTGPPTSMDPTLAATGGATMFTSLAYDSLIYLDRDGNYVPNLATEWAFVDDQNREFRLEIRDDVQFASGEELTAEAVKASIEHFLEGSYADNAGPLEEITTEGNSLTLHYSSPFPDAPLMLTQENRMGNIISPSGLEEPDQLLNQTFGSGQYILDTSATIPDSEYVYTRNPDYWNQDAQQFEEVTIQLISDPNAVLAAASTGQVMTANGHAATVQAAEEAGLEISTVPFFNWSLMLADMDGDVNPALADPKVRQAIALSIDREAIANAISPELSEANGQIMNPGTDGYVEGLDYEYDPEQARELLAESGYPDGFSMTILTQNTNDAQTQRSQAIASALQQVGIDAKLEVVTTGIANFTSEALTQKYEAVIFPVTGTSMGNVQRLMLSGGSRNPFGYVNPEIQALYEESLTASTAAERTGLYEEMSRLHHEDAYVIPVFTALNVRYDNDAITNTGTTAANPTSIPNGPTPELSWQPAGTE